jgi:hypothetical protein
MASGCRAGSGSTRRATGFAAGKDRHQFFGCFRTTFRAGKLFFFGRRENQFFKYILAFFALKFENRHYLYP